MSGEEREREVGKNRKKMEGHSDADLERGESTGMFSCKCLAFFRPRFARFVVGNEKVR